MSVFWFALRGMVLGAILGMCGIYYYMPTFWVLLLAAMFFGGTHE